MDNVLGTLKGLIRDVTEVGIYLLALGVVAGILFGTGEAAQLAFVGNVVGNLLALIKALGDGGLVGLIAVGIILWLLSKRS